MSANSQREGHYRGRVIEYGLYEHKDKQGHAAGLSLFVKCEANEVWMPLVEGEDSQWLDCTGWEQRVAEGYLRLVKKDGKPNDVQGRSLVESIGWDGNILALAERTFQMPDVRFTVEYQTYQRDGVSRGGYRINWLNPFDSAPGGVGNVDADRARSIANQYGSMFRAMAGNQQRTAQPAPAGRPAVPPRRPQPPRQAAAAAPPAERGGDDIPF